MSEDGQGRVQALVAMHDTGRGKEYGKSDRGTFIRCIVPETARLYIRSAYVEFQGRRRTIFRSCFKHFEVVSNEFHRNESNKLN